MLLQKGIELSIGPLTKIFRSFLALGHVQDVWNIERAMFIPKTGNLSQLCINDCRSISLTSFVLNTIKICIDSFIKDKVL